MPLSWIIISHIDLNKSNWSEFVQCIELLLIAELMRLLQAALFLFYIGQRIRKHCLLCLVLSSRQILKEGTKR